MSIAGHATASPLTKHVNPYVEGRDEKSGGERKETPVGQPDENLLPVRAAQAAVDRHGNSVDADTRDSNGVRDWRVAHLLSGS